MNKFLILTACGLLAFLSSISIYAAGPSMMDRKASVGALKLLELTTGPRTKKVIFDVLYRQLSPQVDNLTKKDWQTIVSKLNMTTLNFS